MATVYSDRGQGVRAPVVFYNRSNEAAAQLKPGDIDWKGIFAGGCRWLHSGGIFAALSDSTSQIIIEGMKAAKAAGAVTSFDLNFRAKLWSRLGGTAKAQAVLREIVSHVDVLVGNEEDLQLGLGLKGPDAETKDKLDSSVFFGMMAAVSKDFPQVKTVATTLREVHSTNRHTWGAVLWHEGKTYTSPTCELDVVCRIGGGRRLRRRLHLWPAERQNAGRIPASGLGPRCHAHHHARRHHHGDARSSRTVRQGRLGSRSEISGTT